MRYHEGDPVTAQRQIEGIDVPPVAPGTVGTVLATTLFGLAEESLLCDSDRFGPETLSRQRRSTRRQIACHARFVIVILGPGLPAAGHRACAMPT